MKANLVFPIITAAAGFAIGWVARPGSPETPPVVETKVAERPNRPAPTPAPETPPAEPETTPAPPPAEPPPVRSGAVAASDRGSMEAKAQEAAEKLAAMRNDAKLARLAEVLGLSSQQQTAILDIIGKADEEAMAAAQAGNLGPIEQYELKAQAIEAALAKALTPEQAAEFEKLRARELENRVESTASREFSELLVQVDVTPEQREKILDVMRNAATEDAKSLPDSLNLLLDSSPLPLGTSGIPAQSFKLLQGLAENPINDSADPMAIHRDMIERQTAAEETKLSRYEGILTPSQISQLRVSLQERRSVLDRLMPAQ